ncbi:MAG: hypothetical protein AUG51_12965 [Acidobacteria bacterium 13_1_20CM_3_53_8]|nr:MAG: hypothetical protein AUG51_12965 [Acidobacteria bacterium 13_1_20CM_3_53_8]
MKLQDKIDAQKELAYETLTQAMGALQKVVNYQRELEASLTGPERSKVFLEKREAMKQIQEISVIVEKLEQ